jgi:hypothetical protein
LTILLVLAQSMGSTTESAIREGGTMAIRPPDPGSNLMTGQGVMGSGSVLDWPTVNEYWEAAHTGRPYIREDRPYAYYQGAYRYGSEAAYRHRGRSWADVERELGEGWHGYEHRGTHGAKWEDVRDAVRDGYEYAATRPETRR